MSSRHLSRQYALQILYSNDVDGASTKKKNNDTSINEADIMMAYYEHFNIDQTQQPFTTELVIGTRKNLKTIDHTIESFSDGWKLSRMPSVDRNLLRMASFELLFVDDVPPSVTLDEAVTLAKIFGTNDSASFINGVLDNILKNKDIIRASDQNCV